MSCTTSTMPALERREWLPPACGSALNTRLELILCLHSRAIPTLGRPSRRKRRTFVELPAQPAATEGCGRPMLRVKTGSADRFAGHGFVYFGLLNTGSLVLIFVAIVVSFIP